MTRIFNKALLAFLATGLAAASLQAAADEPPAPLPAPENSHALTTEDVGAFFDGLFPYALTRGTIPGAVVVVVKDGAVLFAKGYGYADVGARTPVDPARTLFRPGSISKTFTWTAVMQLVQAGKIDLDRDINDYLDFKIPATWPKPITMRNIMTHTTGFEETGKNIGFKDPALAYSNEKFLKLWIPDRIFPPGELTGYSNYAAALAGYVVQRVSGEPFEQYIEDHILKPLGMAHSTFRQPLPAGWAADAARGYRSAAAPPKGYEIIAPAPAGALATTGLDMARYMIAHLQDGRFGDQRILDDKTAELMHATAFQPVPPLTGMALGFYHEDRNGQTIIGHSGGTIYFHSDMHLFLDSHVGIFFSMNGSGANGAAGDVLWIRKAVLQDFADRYFPHALPQEPTADTALAHGKLLTGMYETSRRSGYNYFSLFGMLNQNRMSMDKDGILSTPLIPARGGGAPMRWREVQPFMWREVGGDKRLGAKMVDGRVAYLYTDYAAPASVFQPVPAWRSAAWNLPLLVLTLLVLAVTALQWPLDAWLRRAYGVEPRRGHELSRYRLIRAGALANLVFLGGPLLFAVLVIMPEVLPFTDQVDPWLRVFQVFGLFGIVGTLAALAEAGNVWRRGGWWKRVRASLVALAGLAATIWFGIFFDLFSRGMHF